jgi:flagellar assembly protein FliH
VPIKIIKSDSMQRPRIESFLFDGEFPPQNDDVTESSGAVTALFSRQELTFPQKAPQSAPATPPVDLAQIEKHAYENGFHQGEKAGMEIAEKKSEALMRAYAAAILELGQHRRAIYTQVEREVVQLALAVAKKIVHREIRADQEIIQTLVKVALSHVADKTGIRVRLNPADYSYLQEQRSEISAGGAGAEVVLLADKSIQRGGCLVETDCGNIDARIEEEFREVERSFFEGLP